MKAIVVTAYVGPLPVSMPLWLASCAANPDIDWLVVTDQAVDAAQLPTNVTVRHASLDDLRAIFSAEAGFDVALLNPYKLNDFKPLFFTLVEGLDQYDYWGFCDLDVVFGSLRELCRAQFGRAEMILSEGHLRFIRNSADLNRLYRTIAVPRAWDDILRDPANFGMDEHAGINGAFAASGRRIFADPARVADIDPSFRQFRRLPQYRNYRIQAFAYENGRVFREYRHRGRYRRDEFLYVHFQKRKLANLLPQGIASSFFIGPRGFLPREPGQTGRETMIAVNPWHVPNRREIMRVLRMRARMLLRRDDLYSSTLARRK